MELAQALGINERNIPLNMSDLKCDSRTVLRTYEDANRLAARKSIKPAPQNFFALPPLLYFKYSDTKSAELDSALGISIDKI